jgi:uncharacterized membrane protein
VKEWLTTISEFAVVVIDSMALVMVVIGTVSAFIAALRLALSPTSGHERRDVWLSYARWLVAGLTFQLAADIIESALITSWDAVARLGAVAAIRTFLNYFLEHDLAEIRERQLVSSAQLPGIKEDSA